eukprot:COSAG06_NODE_64_length_26790_cov_7.462291_11_plen_76_part_00
MEIRLSDIKLALPGRPQPLQKRLCLSNFSSVCPEPVLANIRFSTKRHAKRTVSAPAEGDCRRWDVRDCVAGDNGP